MKKLYLLFIAILPFISLAQPTIQQSDEPVIGLGFLTGIDPTYSGEVPGGGANITWDYSSLLNQQAGGALFLNAVGTPYAPVFTNAYMATHDTSNNQWAYFHGSPSGFYADGIDTGGINAVINPPLLYVPVPFTYLDMRASVGRIEYDTTYIIFPVKLIRTYIDTFSAAGWGTLIVPGNTFTNTLMIDDKQVTIDSVLVNFGTGDSLLSAPAVAQTHYYRWVRHNGTDAFLLQIDADSAATIATRSEYQIASALITVPEIAAAQEQIKSYPNPAANVIHIDFGTDKGTSGSINIYNSVGEIVRTTYFSDINHLTMSVNTFSNGIYHFSVNSSDNKIREGSFIVNR